MRLKGLDERICGRTVLASEEESPGYERSSLAAARTKHGSQGSIAQEFLFLDTNRTPPRTSAFGPTVACRLMRAKGPKRPSTPLGSGRSSPARCEASEVV